MIHILWWKKPDLKDCHQYDSLSYDIPVKEEVWGQKSYQCLPEPGTGGYRAFGEPVRNFCILSVVLVTQCICYSKLENCTQKVNFTICKLYLFNLEKLWPFEGKQASWLK